MCFQLKERAEVVEHLISGITVEPIRLGTA
jgi:hypothetical protein